MTTIELLNKREIIVSYVLASFERDGNIVILHTQKNMYYVTRYDSYLNTIRVIEFQSKKYGYATFIDLAELYNRLSD